MPELTPTTPIQATIPRRAFEALDLERIRDRLIGMQAPQTRFEANEHHAGYGNVRLTTMVAVAVVIVDELRIQTGEAERRGDSQTLFACAEAVAAIFKAMDDEKARFPDDCVTYSAN